MDSMKVAVIDSGFDSNVKLSNPIAHMINVARQSVASNTRDTTGHGTCIIKTIDAICSDIQFYIVKIFDRENSSDYEQLETALCYCLDWGVDVVNLSLGVEDPSYEARLKSICRELEQSNILLLTTRAEHEEQRNELWTQNNVIRVKGGKSIYDDLVYCHDSIFYVKGIPRFLPWLHGRYVFSGANSFSVPLIMPHVITAMRKNGNSICGVVKRIAAEAERISYKEIEVIDDLTRIVKEDIKDNQIYEKCLINIRDILGQEASGKMLFQPDLLLGASSDYLFDFVSTLCGNLGVPFYPESFTYQKMAYAENISNHFKSLIDLNDINAENLRR